MTINRPLACFLLTALAVCGNARAHDSWLAPPAVGEGDLLTLTFTTGNRFPKAETAVPAAGIVGSGCIDAKGRTHDFRPRGVAHEALLLRVRAGSEPVLGCWLRTQVFEVQIDPPTVDVYLKEVRAPAAVVQAWQAQRSQGIAWQESYEKNARIELVRGDAAGLSLAGMRKPIGRGLELLPVGGDALRVGATFTLQVLLDGRPLAGQAVELVSERNPLGIWRESDAQGHVQYPMPLAGRWLLRATHLVKPTGGAERRWRSQFATLAVQVP